MRNYQRGDRRRTGRGRRGGAFESRGGGRGGGQRRGDRRDRRGGDRKFSGDRNEHRNENRNENRNGGGRRGDRNGFKSKRGGAFRKVSRDSTEARDRLDRDLEAYKNGTA